ncbi:MAG: NAD(+)/NADH kinase [Anaerotignum sp.]
MQKIGLIPNIDKDKDLAVTKRLVNYILEKGCVPQLTEKVAEKTGFQRYAQNELEIYKHSDFIISLGGDGTLLGVGRKACRYNTPILGVNLGTLGFLTTAEKNKAEDALDCVLMGQYKKEKRMMLQTTISLEDGRTGDITALNDICITRGLLYKILEFNVFVNDEYVDTLRADGVIICTPTGSTAYNLSAGGPVLKADAEIIGITPIAAHTLSSRPIVVSANDVITVEINPREDTEFTVSADGQEGWSLTGNKIVKIRKAEAYTTIIKTNSQSFYDVLRHKLSR